MTVEREIARGNQWYVSDQADQLASAGGRAAIESRWRIFEQIVLPWLVRRTEKNLPVFCLDAGCGDGNNLVALTGIVEAGGCVARAIGLDYNELRLARSRDRTGAPPLKADLLCLPFADGTFDLILCNHVIEHIADDIGVLRELARVLKSDGLLVVGVPNEGCGLAQLRNCVLQRSILRSTDHVHFYTSRILIDRVQRAGLRPAGDIQREGFFMPHLRLMNFLRDTNFGRRIINLMVKLLPSQSAGLLLAAVHCESLRRGDR